MQSTHPRDRLPSVIYRTIDIDQQPIFYREAGSPDRPTLVLPHGFPTSSHMFQELIFSLSSMFHLVAPDYPGVGDDAMLSVDEFNYTFDHLALVIDRLTVKLGLKRYGIYLMSYTERLSACV